MLWSVNTFATCVDKLVHSDFTPMAMNTYPNDIITIIAILNYKQTMQGFNTYSSLC